MGASKRKKLIDEASQYVTKDRNTSYGEPEDNFQAIADVWNAQGVRIDKPHNGSHRNVTSTDVALMMAGMKLARLKTNPSHRDSWVDLIGYAACGGDIALPDEDDEPDELEETQVEEAIRGVGRWVSDNRCGDAHPHIAHPYGTDAFEQPNRCVHIQPCNWCDGYVVEPVSTRHRERSIDVEQTQQSKDVETVKRVADKLNFGPLPRPIKDAPQA
jgi:hypothetical protein